MDSLGFAAALLEEVEYLLGKGVSPGPAGFRQAVGAETVTVLFNEPYGHWVMATGVGGDKKTLNADDPLECPGQAEARLAKLD